MLCAELHERVVIRREVPLVAQTATGCEGWRLRQRTALRPEGVLNRGDRLTAHVVQVRGIQQRAAVPGGRGLQRQAREQNRVELNLDAANAISGAIGLESQVPEVGVRIAEGRDDVVPLFLIDG